MRAATRKPSTASRTARRPRPPHGSSAPSPRNATAVPRTAPARKWSQDVTDSDALDLEGGVFAQKDPKRIAVSLKRAAERSDRRESSPFRPAMSMLTFYLNRAGALLSAARRRRIETAKAELRKLYGRDDPASTPNRPARRPTRRRRAVRRGKRATG